MRQSFSISALLLLIVGLTPQLWAADAYDPTANKTEFASINLDWQDPARDREIPVKIYYPKEMTGKLPVIIFSHGLGG